MRKKKMLSLRDDYRFKTQPYACSYLPDRIASLDYRIIQSLEPREYSKLLALGWRRHGLHIFRPACSKCLECKSLRVRIEGFNPSKSQRRILRTNSNVKLVVRKPTITPQHIELFNRYHHDMHLRRSWRTSFPKAWSIHRNQETTRSHLRKH